MQSLQLWEAPWNPASWKSNSRMWPRAVPKTQPGKQQPCSNMSRAISQTQTPKPRHWSQKHSPGWDRSGHWELGCCRHAFSHSSHEAAPSTAHRPNAASTESRSWESREPGHIWPSVPADWILWLLSISVSANNYSESTPLCHLGRFGSSLHPLLTNPYLRWQGKGGRVGCTLAAMRESAPHISYMGCFN